MPAWLTSSVLYTKGLAILFNIHLRWTLLSKSDAILPIDSEVNRTTSNSVQALPIGRSCNASRAFLNQTRRDKTSESHRKSQWLVPPSLCCHSRCRRVPDVSGVQSGRHRSLRPLPPLSREPCGGLMSLVARYCDPPRCHVPYCLTLSTMCQEFRYQLYDGFDAALTLGRGRVDGW